MSEDRDVDFDEPSMLKELYKNEFRLRPVINGYVVSEGGEGGREFVFIKFAAAAKWLQGKCISDAERGNK